MRLHRFRAGPAGLSHAAVSLAIEILSKDDRASDLQEKLDDYRDFGIPFVWVIDPRTRLGYTYCLEDGFETVRPGLYTKNPDLELPLAQLFE